jgi:OPA family glycerol-3-phosphate transporter-like MFS transporter
LLVMQNSENSTAEDPRYQRWRAITFGITWLAYVGFYFTRKSLPVAKIGILADPTLEITRTSLGWIDGLFGVAYALGQFIWGMCGDKFGPRKVVLTGMFFSIIVAVAMGMSSTVVLFGVLFFCQGLCQSTGWAPLTKNVSYWFSRKERGRTYGFWATNYDIGGMLAGAFAGYMALVFLSWRFAFFMPAIVLAVIWLLFLFLQKNRPEDIGLPSIEDYHGEAVDVLAKGETSEDEPEGSWKMIGEVFRNPVILSLGAVYFFLKPTRYAMLFWGPLIINDKLGTNIGESALISAAFEAAGPLGVIFAGYASDKWFQSRRMPVTVFGLSILAIILFLFNGLTEGGGKGTIVLLLLAMGFFCFGPDAMISSTSAVDFGTKKAAASSAGLINGMGSTGQILGLSLPGIIWAKYGWGMLFNCMGAFVLLAALLLLPRWNALPATVEKKIDSR